MHVRRLSPLCTAAIVAAFAVPIVVAGCAHMTGWTTTATPPALPVRHEMIRGQLVIRSDDPLPQHHRLIDELTAQRSDLLALFNLPPGHEPIQIYLFSSAGQFKGFIRARHPDLPDRRAFFVEKDTALEVYAAWGDRVAEDLRHEVTHGYLHSIVPRIPLWLDEGIAEYFEVPRGTQGLNRPHVEHLAQRLQEGWQPNLRRLETLAQPSDMDQMDYAESWGWVHMLVHTRPEHRRALCEFLADIRTNGAATPLSARLARFWPNPDEALPAYLRQLIAQTLPRQRSS